MPIENLTKEELFTIAKRILIDYGWEVKDKDTVLEAEGKCFRNDFFDIRTYRNKITLLYEEENLFINCMVEPPKNGQFVTFGKMNQFYDDFTNLFLDGAYHWDKEKRKSHVSSNQ